MPNPCAHQRTGLFKKSLNKRPGNFLKLWLINLSKSCEWIAFELERKLRRFRQIFRLVYKSPAGDSPEEEEIMSVVFGSLSCANLVNRLICKLYK